jgi:NADH-quinone oxidoreductase subunit B
MCVLRRHVQQLRLVQGVDHIVPVDIYLPGCPPRPEMLIDASLKLRDKIGRTRLGANREREIAELERARLRSPRAPG